jgi:hypothetical protein
MIDGFWIITIEAPGGISGGVAVLLNGKIFGGDSGFSWIGSYSVHDRLIKARFQVSNFNPSIESIFGYTNDYELHFSGQLQDDVLIGTAVVANQPQHSLSLRLTKKAEI